MARNYSNVAEETTLSAAINSSATSITVGSNTGYPAAPYTILVDPGLPTEEVVEVTAVAGTTWTVTRGVDGTPASSHDLGAVVVHGYSARDLREPQDHIAATSNVHGVTGSVVGTTSTQTLLNKTLTSPTISGGTITGVTFGAGLTFQSPTLVTPTIASFVNAQHTHADAASGGAIGGGGGGFFFPDPVTATSDFNLTGSQQDMGGMSITYSSPSSWPASAKRILYTVTFEAACQGAQNVFVGFKTGTTDVVPDGGLHFNFSELSGQQAYTFSWPGTLTSTSTSHTAKVTVQGSDTTVFNRAFWLTLI